MHSHTKINVNTKICTWRKDPELLPMLGCWRDDRDDDADTDAAREREWEWARSPPSAATRTSAAASPPVELLVAGGAPPTAAVGPPPALHAPRAAPILSCLGAVRWKAAGMPLRSSCCCCCCCWAFLCAAEAEALRARACACVEERPVLLPLLAV